MKESEQLRLQVTPRLAYSGANFIQHAGMREAIEQLTGAAQTQAFKPALVIGGARSGKTHFALMLLEIFARQGKFPRLIEGAALAAALSDKENLMLREDDVVVVDDADIYFRILQPGASGAFVNFFEAARLARAQLVFMLATDPAQLPCDDHVMSRLRASASFVIGAPSEPDLSPLIDAMSRQRGIALTQRQREYLRKRLPRSISEIEDYLDGLAHLTHTLGRAVPLPAPR